jgi:type IV pilus assembly protein PilM
MRIAKPKSHTHVGLHIEPGRASAVAVDRRRVLAASSVELEPGAVTGAGVADPASLAHSLRELFAHAGLERRVYLGLSIQHGVVRLLDMPLIEDEKERDTAVRFQAAEAIAMPLEDAILDYSYVGQTVTPGAGTRMQIILAAARRGPVQELVGAVQAAGLKPLGLELEPFALVRALGSQASENEAARLYCHLGSTAVLAIAVGQVCLFTRSAPAAGAGLVEQVRMLLGYYASQPGSDGVAEVVVSGAGPHGETSIDALGVPDGIPVRFAAPLGRLEVAAGAREDHRRLTVATGLALGALS